LDLDLETPMLNRRKALGAAIGLIAAGGAVQRARAQAVDKVVHIIVGFPAGGGTDIVARVLAQALGGIYAASIIVENSRAPARGLPWNMSRTRRRTAA
jgi:tripartite-type tricarboxylate transporter receptor subunit TctC